MSSGKNRDSSLEIAPFTHNISTPAPSRRPTELQQRIARQVETDTAAIRGKGPEAVEAQKAIAGIYGHGLHVQGQLTNYAYDLVERQTRQEDREYLGAIGRQTIEMANQDIAAVSRSASQRIQEVVSQAALPAPDTRSKLGKLFKAGPED